MNKSVCWVNPSGDKYWRLGSITLHREDGPAIEYLNGDKAWYIKGKRHRENKPAIEFCNSYKSWWQNGKRHREDGPAVERIDGSKAWFLNDKKYTEEEYREYQLTKALAGI